MLITDYRLMLFTIFNNYLIQLNPKEFKFMTEEEEIDEFDKQIEYYKNKGYFKDALNN